MVSPRPSEEQWELFTTLLELSVEDRFEVVLIACADRATEEALRARMKAHCEGEERLFDEPKPGEDPLDWLSGLRGAAPASKGRAPLLFLRLPEDNRVFILHRLNENRDNLRREARGVLCLVGGEDFLRVVPNEAPDLWSVRERMFEFAFSSVNQASARRPSAPSPGPKMDVFLSVSRHDLPSLTSTIDELRRDGILLDVGADGDERYDIAVAEGLSESRLMMIALSPEYLRSVWADMEPLLERDEGLLRRTILLKLYECIIPEPLRALGVLDWTTEESRVEAYPRLLEMLRGAMFALPLTKRESEIAKLLIHSDLDVKEIAAKLGISNSTVKKHLQHIYNKLGRLNREELTSKLRALP